MFEPQLVPAVNIKCCLTPSRTFLLPSPFFYFCIFLQTLLLNQPELETAGGRRWSGRGSSSQFRGNTVIWSQLQNSRQHLEKPYWEHFLTELIHFRWSAFNNKQGLDAGQASQNTFIFLSTATHYTAAIQTSISQNSKCRRAIWSLCCAFFFFSLSPAVMNPSLMQSEFIFTRKWEMKARTGEKRLG